MKPGIKKRMELLSDELAMYSSQLREALSGGGDPPHPWNIEPWLSEYARAFKEWKSPNEPSSPAGAASCASPRGATS